MTSSMNDEWQLKTKQFCEEFNIPTNYLADTLYDPKVIPMIRGKAFEYSAMLALRGVLNSDIWEVSKPYLNPQLGSHDMDIKILHKPTGKIIRVECKLAAKESFRYSKDGQSRLEVKCMRSRTLGLSMVKALAPKLGVDEDTLTTHNDQYLPADFDVVITSIGNAFYRTNEKTKVFEWKPTEQEITFLQSINLSKDPSLKDFAFNQLYLSRSTNLVKSKIAVVCTRKKCKNKTNCPFIPNYPKIMFDPSTNEPTNGWVKLDECEGLLKEFLN